MASTDRSVREAARSAYELGRLRLGLRSALWVLPMVALSLVACRQPVLTVIAGAVLFALVTALRWRGQVLGRAAMPGLLAGAVPLVLPLALRTTGHGCIGGACWAVCMIGCIGGGLVAGISIGLLSAREKDQRWTFLLAATSVAGLAGILGCVMAGAAGIAGMTLAVLGSSLPVAVVARVRAS